MRGATCAVDVCRPNAPGSCTVRPLRFVLAAALGPALFILAMLRHGSATYCMVLFPLYYSLPGVRGVYLNGGRSSVKLAAVDSSPEHPGAQGSGYVSLCNHTLSTVPQQLILLVPSSPPACTHAIQAGKLMYVLILAQGEGPDCALRPPEAEPPPPEHSVPLA